MVWYPTHNSVPRLIKQFIPFGNKTYNNHNYIINNEHINNTYLKTCKLKIYPNWFQQTVINGWLLEVNKIYNYTNQYLKNKICKPFPFMEKNIIKYSYKFIDDFKLVKKTLNFQLVRNEINNYINEIFSYSSTYRHTLDYAVKLCVEMYKSAFSNYKAGNINHFNVKDIKSDKRRFNLTLEPTYFSKQFNAFGYKELGLMKSDKPFKSFNINHNVILQYDQLNKSYYLLIPLDKTINTIVYREDKCGPEATQVVSHPRGIDIGCRTFMTIYSNNKCIEVGNDKIINCIDRVNKKLDKLKSDYDFNKIKTTKYNKVRKKYQLKIQNKVEDMHKKVANYLLKNYETINIGKVSIKSMVSKLTGNIKEVTKRRLLKLSHFKFREYLKLNASKYGNFINEIDEYLTSKNVIIVVTLKRI
jgi:IS605 OrfB family transposase